MEFARAYPALMRADGWPLSWMHYVVGIRALGRAHAFETLERARAVRAAYHADENGWKDYVNDHRTAARLDG